MTYFDFTEFTKTPLKLYSSGTRVDGSTISSTYSVSSLENSPAYIPAAGFSKSDISAEIKSERFLLITGKTENFNGRHIDLMYTLPENTDLNSIEVTVTDGMITITFENKKEETKKIKVK